MSSSNKTIAGYRKRHAWRASLVLGLATSLTLAACGSSGTKSANAGSTATTAGSGSGGTSATAAKPTGTIHIGLSSAMNTLSPLPFGAKNFEVYNDLYGTPVTVSNGQPQAALAQSWTMASDGSSLTLKLRPGLTFSDGTPLDAAAIVWNVKWEQDPTNAAHALSLWQQVTATAVDSTTVKLAFTHPIAAIYSMLGGMPIVKPNAPNSGVSSGPFMVSKFVPGTSLAVVANPHYWGTPPRAQQLVFTNYTETATAALALRSGTIDLLVGPPPTQVASLKAAGDKFLSGAVTNDGYTPYLFLSLLVNTSTPPLNDVRVRQALSLAFDRAQFVSTALAGAGVPAESVIEPSSPAYQPSPSTASFDLQKAKSLLQQAGVSNLTLSVDTVSILPQTTFMPVYQQDLAKIGITLKINQIDPATWATIVGPGNFPNLITQENGFVDTDPAINFGNLDLAPTHNSEHFTSAQYTQMIQAAAQETDPAKRQADYKAIGAYLQQQMFIIPLADVGSNEAAYSAKVSGVQPASFSGIDFPSLSIG